MIGYETQKDITLRDVWRNEYMVKLMLSFLICTIYETNLSKINQHVNPKYILNKCNAYAIFPQK